MQGYACSNAGVTNVCCDNDGAGPCKQCGSSSSTCTGTFNQIGAACDYNHASCGTVQDCDTLIPKTYAEYGRTGSKTSYNNGVIQHGFATGHFSNANPSNLCGTYGCVYKMNTAAANDCSTYTDFPSSYGITLKTWSPTDIYKEAYNFDTSASSWPTKVFFLV